MVDVISARAVVSVAVACVLSVGCATDPASTPETHATILARLATFTQYGWEGGAANSGSGAPTVAFSPIVAMDVAGDSITFSYEWKDGSVTGTLSGNQLTGLWTQTNGSGPQELDFDENGDFVTGWWADASNPTKHQPAFLR